MTNLHLAPPPFDGNVFVDITNATYEIVFDVGTETAKVKSRIRFVTEQVGKPMLDLQCRPSVVTEVAVITGAGEMPAPFDEILLAQDPGEPESTMLALSCTLDPGEHVLEMTHTLNEVDAKTTGFLTWYEGAAQCVFHMSDIIVEGRTRGFLGSYVPANFEFDQFSVEMHVSVVRSGGGAVADHLLVANASRMRQTGNAWVVEYPAHFTSSFFWFHLVPKQFVREYPFAARSHHTFLYAMKSQPVASLLPDFADGLGAVVEELELNFGTFPYSNLIVFAHGFLNGRGMEYAGAAVASFDVLRHELDHSYFARCVAPADGNAGWVDEAIATWGDFGYYRRSEPPELLPSDLATRGLGAHSPYQRVTDRRATRIGRDLLAHIDWLLDGKGVPNGLKGFLREYYRLNRNKVVQLETFQAQLGAHARQHGAEALEPVLDVLFDRYVNRTALLIDELQGSGRVVRPAPPLAASDRRRGHERSAKEIQRIFLA